MMERPRLPHGWELASFKNRAAAMGGRAERVWWRRMPLMWLLDGDYSDRPSEPPILLAPIEAPADITLGSRLGGNNCPRALPWYQSFGNRLSAGLIRLLYGVKISDLGLFRAGRADLL